MQPNSPGGNPPSPAGQPQQPNAPRSPRDDLPPGMGGAERNSGSHSPREDLPPGMGGGEQSYAPQPYQAQSGAPTQPGQPGYQQGQHQPNYYPPATPAVQVGTMNVKAWGGMGLGLLLIVIGAGATMYSYNSAGAPGSDGTYTIWWGPIVFGVIVFIGGVGALFKN